jgi:hypothetical protein
MENMNTIIRSAGMAFVIVAVVAAAASADV